MRAWRPHTVGSHLSLGLFWADKRSQMELPQTYEGACMGSSPNGPSGTTSAHFGSKVKSKGWFWVDAWYLRTKTLREPSMFRAQVLSKLQGLWLPGV